MDTRELPRMKTTAVPVPPPEPEPSREPESLFRNPFAAEEEEEFVEDLAELREAVGDAFGVAEEEEPVPSGDFPYVGTGTGWLIRGSDTFQTSVRPVSCRMHSPCHSVSSPMHSPCHHVMSDAQSCRMHRSVMSDAQCHFGCTVLTEIHDSGPKVVQCWYGSGPLMFSLCAPSSGTMLVQATGSTGCRR